MVARGMWPSRGGPGLNVSRQVGQIEGPEAQEGRSGRSRSSGPVFMGMGVGNGGGRSWNCQALGLLKRWIDPEWGAGEERGDRRQREQKVPTPHTPA